VVSTVIENLFGFNLKQADVVPVVRKPAQPGVIPVILGPSVGRQYLKK